MPVAPTPITALPVPPSRDDSATFSDRADAFLGALPAFRTEANAIGTNVYTNAVEVNSNATTVASNTTLAVNSANAAAGSAGAAAWVSGTTYALGAVVWSPANGQIYRRLIAGGGTTDPSLDGTNWTNVYGFTFSGNNATLSGNLTLSGGTANGVLYLNASKVATSGSALTFDGTNLSASRGLKAASAGIVVSSFVDGLSVGGYESIGFLASPGTALAIGGYRTSQWSGLEFYTSGTLKAVLDTSGNLGIGTTSWPSAQRLRVAGGDVGFEGQYLYLVNANADIQLGAAQNSKITNTDSTNTLSIARTGASSIITLSTAGSERMRLDSSGNLGLGVTPSAWLSAYRSISVGYAGNAISSDDSQKMQMGANFYRSATADTYANNGAATLYQQSAGIHKWFTAPSGTAGNTITFTTAMTLDASGRLLVGTTSQGGMLTVSAPASTIYGAFDCVTDGFGYLTMKNGTTTCGYVGPGSLTTGNQMAIASAGALPLTFGTNGTERARITSGGFFKASDSGTYQSAGASYHEFVNTTNNETVIVTNTNASFDANALQIRASRNTTNNTFYALAYYNLGAAAYKFRVADSGAIATAGGIALGTDTPATSGVGVQFPATQSASSNANTLDDYEEGTFTPTVSGSTSAGTGTYTTQSGNYIKVGKFVHVQARVTWTAHTGTGSFLLTGLPFTSGNTAQGGVSIGYANDIAAGGTNIITGIVNSSATSIGLESYPAGGGASGAINIDAAGDIIYTTTYIASA